MSKSDYLPYFILNPPELSSQTIFGISHFYNRFKTAIDWDSYNEVITNTNGSGRVILGQIPITDFNSKLLQELSINDNALVISCNDCFELAGCGTTYNVVKPFLWNEINIIHHHLPFTDFSDNANQVLIIDTLKKMIDVYNEGWIIYVHCKAGRSRSAFIVALFHCLITYGEQLYNCCDEDDIKEYFRSSIIAIKESRPQISIGSSKFELGIGTIKTYLIVEHEIIEENTSYLQSVDFLSQLSQSSSFKELWNFAYNNKRYFIDVQQIFRSLYENPETVLIALESTEEAEDSELKKACLKINQNTYGYQILTNLKTYMQRNQFAPYVNELTELNLAYKEFNEALLFYNQPEVVRAARYLQNEIFISRTSNKNKIYWLKQTTEYLNNPEIHTNSYMKAANNVLKINSAAFQFIGKSIQLLGLSLLGASLIASIAILTIISFSTLGAAFISSLILIGIGKFTTKVATENKATEYSHELVKQIYESAHFDYR